MDRAALKEQRSEGVDSATPDRARLRVSAQHTLADRELAAVQDGAPAIRGRETVAQADPAQTRLAASVDVEDTIELVGVDDGRGRPRAADGDVRSSGRRRGQVEVAVVVAVDARGRAGQVVGAAGEHDDRAGAADPVRLHHRRAQRAGAGGGVADAVGGVVVDLIEGAVDVEEHLRPTGGRQRDASPERQTQRAGRSKPGAWRNLPRFQRRETWPFDHSIHPRGTRTHRGAPAH